MNDRPRTRINGRESAVGTHPGYQLRGVKVNRYRDRLRCKKKELWIFHQILWKTGQNGDSAPNRWALADSHELHVAGRVIRSMNDCATLRFGALGRGSAHLCVDMQTVFAERTDWHVPWLERVLPTVRWIAESYPDKTIFTRFIPPDHPEQMPGAWQRCYRRWRHMTGDRIDPGLIELVPALRSLVPPAAIVDKCHYSPFAEPALPRLLRERSMDTLVITGGETDVCVLATVLGAVDWGLRVILVTDALCSTSDEAHDSVLSLYRGRFSQQIEVASAEEVLGNWR